MFKWIVFVGFIIFGITNVDAQFHKIYKNPIQTLSGGSWQSLKTVPAINGGGFVATGTTFDTAGKQAGLLMRFDDNMEVLWEKEYYDTASGEINFYNLDLTQDRGFVITGAYSGGQTLVIKTDSLGNQEWSKKYYSYMKNLTTGIEANWVDVGFDVLQSFDGGYLITGYTNKGFGSLVDMQAIKINNIGDTLWTKHIQITSFLNASASIIQLKNDSSYIVSGGASGLILFRISDKDGSIKWLKNFQLQGEMRSLKLIDEKYVIALSILKGGFSGDLMLQKVDTAGNQIWAKRYSYGNPTQIAFNSLQIAADYDIVIGG